MSAATLALACDEATRLRSRLFADSPRGKTDEIAIAVAFLTEATAILRTTCGSAKCAGILYAAADREAAP